MLSFITLGTDVIKNSLFIKVHTTLILSSILFVPSDQGLSALFAFWLITVQIQIRWHGCAGLSGSALFSHVIKGVYMEVNFLSKRKNDSWYIFVYKKDCEEDFFIYRSAEALQKYVFFKHIPLVWFMVMFSFLTRFSLEDPGY
jgi:hypothetical protein